MKKPLSVVFVAAAILLGQAGAIDLDITWHIDGNSTGSGAHAQDRTEAEAVDPCLGDSFERDHKAESLFALSSFRVL